MRAREFVSKNVREDTTISIPIKITIPNNGASPDVSVKPDTPDINIQNNIESPTQDTSINTPRDVNPNNETDPDAEGVMVPPLQQELELEKSDAGKDSEVIDQLTQDEEDEDDDDNLPLAYR